MSKIETVCYCGNNVPYTQCCGQYIDGSQHAPTPEKLMRSRYVAFVQANTDYIAATMIEPAGKDFDPIQAKAWASQANWLGLVVIAAERNWVEFCASYELDGEKKHIHEKSKFKIINERWFYYDGQQIKLKPNDLCFCGSGKKFKKCCVC